MIAAPWSSTLLSSLSIRSPNRLSRDSARRIWTKTLMISILVAMALGLRSTLESIATPCSVKAHGRLRSPPQLEMPNWHFKLSHSFFVNRNMKSSGNLSALRRTARVRAPVDTSYNCAKSLSMMTWQPRRTWITEAATMELVKRPPTGSRLDRPVRSLRRAGIARMAASSLPARPRARAAGRGGAFWATGAWLSASCSGYV